MREFVLWLERHYSTPTRRQYLRRIANIEEWLAEHNYPPLRRANWKTIRDYGRTLPHTYASRSGLRSAIAAYWRFLGRAQAPTWAVECPKKPDGHYRGLEGPEQIARLISAARTLGTPQHVACCALYYQGLRREEAARMRWDDLHPPFLHGVGKGNREFRVPLEPRFAASLEALNPTGPWILEGRWPGTHVSPATVWMWVRLASERAGLGRTTPHQLRHTSIATVHDATGNLRTAMEFARHRSPDVTRIYTRTKLEDLRRGMEAL